MENSVAAATEERRSFSSQVLEHFASGGKASVDPKHCYAIAGNLSPNLQVSVVSGDDTKFPSSRDAILGDDFTLNLAVIGSLLDKHVLPVVRDNPNAFEMSTHDTPEMVYARNLVKHIAAVVHSHVAPVWRQAKEMWFNVNPTLIAGDVLSFLSGAVDDHFERRRSTLSASLFVATIEGWLKNALPMALRAMGDDAASNRIPRKAVEFLSLPALGRILREELVLLTRILCGPPPGLNFRNVIWHGYLGEGEFPEALATLLIVHMFTLGKALSKLLEPVSVDPPVPPVLTAKVSIRQVVIPEIQPSHTSSVADVSYESIAKELLDLLPHTYAVVPNQIGVWKESFEYLSQRDYLRFIASAVPLLEHTLRRIYVCVNNVEERLYKAETYALMVTFDMMFAKRISPTGERLGELGNADDCKVQTMGLDPDDPSLIPNKMFEEFDSATMHLLYDVFMWNEAPRVRDMIAHGVLHSRVPEWSVRFVIAVTVTLFTKYPASKPQPAGPGVLAYSLFVKDYRPYFHTKSVLVRGVQALRDRAKALTAFAAKALVDRPPLQPLLKQPAVEVPLSVISDRVDFTINEIVKKIAGGGSFASVFEDIDDESRTVQVGHFDVLFKTRDEYVKLGFISIILADVNLFVDAVMESYNTLHQKVIDRTAWQAQRKIYISLVDCLGVFPQVLRVFGAVVEVFIDHNYEPDEYIRGSLWHCIRILGTFKAAALANASRKCVELLCTFIGVVGVQPRILSKAELKNYKETLFVLYPEAKQPKPTQ